MSNLPPDNSSSARRAPIRCPGCARLLRLGARACQSCGTVLVEHYQPLQPGQSLAQRRYTVQRPLSRGAMGALYLATDHTAFDRTVVIKALLNSPNLTNPREVQAARERFEQEARTLAALKHPTIPQIFTYFQEGWQNYIVMEYIEGDDLDQRLSSRDEDTGTVRVGSAYPRDDVIRWGITICQALEYLGSRTPHAVVHQDIKPANLVLDSNSQSIRLVDFGTAKTRVLVGKDGRVGLKQSSAFGTQGYAPPEQYRGQSEPRSDVYALAATLYHLATDDDPGEHIFEFPRLGELGSLGQVLTEALRQQASHRPSAALFRQQLEKLLLSDSIRAIEAPDGTLLNNEQELAAWCEQHWMQAVYWLYNRLPEQVEQVWMRHRLAEQMRKAIQTHDSDRHAGLDAVLALLDPHGFGAEQSDLRAEHTMLDFGSIAAGAGSQRALVLVNRGRRYVRAQLQLPAWVSTGNTTVSLLAGERATFKLHADVQRLPLSGKLRAHVQASQQGTPLVQVPVQSFVSRWRTLWRRYPLPIGSAAALLLLLLLGLGAWGAVELYASDHYLEGAAALERGAWEEARQDLAQISGYRDADTLLLETHYRPGLDALERGDWPRARRELEHVRALQPDYRSTATLLQESYYRPGKAALERGAWSEAREELAAIPGYRDADTLLKESYYRAGKAALERGAWSEAREELAQIPGYRDADTLLKESYYRAGQLALDQGAWSEARSQFNQLLALQQDYRNTATLLQESYYRAGRVALEQGDWVAARDELTQVRGYRDADTLLKESYYQPATRAIAAGQWERAAEALLELNRLDSSYRDVPALLAAHPELVRGIAQHRAAAWQSGQVSEARTLTGHGNNVHTVAWSPDGRVLASGGWDTTVHLWQAHDGTLLRTLTGHERYVSAVAFSPDGQTLASASADHTLRLWRVEDGALLHTLTAHDNYVSAVAFSPDGQTLASASWDTNIGLWRVADGALLHTLRGPSAVVESVAWSPDGQTLASGGWDNTITLWQVADGTPLRTLTGHEWHVSSVAWSPDGQMLASGAWDKTVRLWRVADGTLLHTLTRHSDDVRSVAWSPDGQTLASGSGGLLERDTSIKLWRVADGTLLHTLDGHTDWVHSVAFSPDGRLLASASFDQTVKLWQTEE